MITDFKCNKVWFSDLLAKRHPTIHEKLVDTLNRNDIEHEGISGTKDIWCRDYMPVQVDEDYDAFEQIRKAMPRRQRIVMVEATDLAKEGGCFNCVSWTTVEPNCVF